MKKQTDDVLAVEKKINRTIIKFDKRIEKLFKNHVQISNLDYDIKLKFYMQKIDEFYKTQKKIERIKAPIRDRLFRMYEESCKKEGVEPAFPIVYGS